MSSHLPKPAINYNNNLYNKSNFGGGTFGGAGAAGEWTSKITYEPVKIVSQEDVKKVKEIAKNNGYNTQPEPDPTEYRYNGSIALDQEKFRGKLLIDNKLKGIDDLDQEQLAAVLEGFYFVATSFNVGGKAVGLAKGITAARGTSAFAAGMANGYGVLGSSLQAWSATGGKISFWGYKPFHMHGKVTGKISDLGHWIHEQEDKITNLLTFGRAERFLQKTGGLYSFTPGLNIASKFEGYLSKQLFFYKPYYNDKKEKKVIKAFEEMTREEQATATGIIVTKEGDMGTATSIRNQQLKANVDAAERKLEIKRLVKDFENRLKPRNSWIERFERIMIPDKFTAYDNAKKYLSDKAKGFDVSKFAYDLTVGGLFDAINKYTDATQAKNALRQGRDQNRVRDEQLATFIVALKNAGGNYSYDRNGDILIVPPEPKKQEATTKTILKASSDATENKALTQKVNMQESYYTRGQIANALSDVQIQKGYAALSAARTAAFDENVKLATWANAALGTNFQTGIMARRVEDLERVELKDGRIVSGKIIRSWYYMYTR